VGEWPEHKTQKEKEKGWEVIYIQTGKKNKKQKKNEKRRQKNGPDIRCRWWQLYGVAVRLVCS